MCVKMKIFSLVFHEIYKTKLTKMFNNTFFKPRIH